MLTRKPLTTCERRWAEAGTVLYFAYGMNMPLSTMPREPHARRLGRALLRDWRLRFRGYADVEESEGDVVYGALWRLDARGLAEMDGREGYYPGRANNLYDRIEVTVETDEGERTAYVYRMVNTGRSIGSSPGYVNLLRRGYTELNLPLGELDNHPDLAPQPDVCDECGGPLRGVPADASGEHRTWCPEADVREEARV